MMNHEVSDFSVFTTISSREQFHVSRFLKVSEDFMRTHEKLTKRTTAGMKQF